MTRRPPGNDVVFGRDVCVASSRSFPSLQVILSASNMYEPLSNGCHESVLHSMFSKMIVTLRAFQRDLHRS